jgi:GT2 family glycosyltransferase
MFMLIPAAVFRKIGGFDERYFLYYEDVDLCARMRLGGYDIRLCPNAKVIHEARRQSHRDLRYFRWHLASILRFFFSKPFITIMWRRRKSGKP